MTLGAFTLRTDLPTDCSTGWNHLGAELVILNIRQGRLWRRTFDRRRKSRKWVFGAVWNVPSCLKDEGLVRRLEKSPKSPEHWETKSWKM